MKARMSIKNILITTVILCFASMFFIMNVCFAGNTGKITTETVRIREQPKADAKVLELASIGDDVEILENENGWYKVKYKSVTGYIRNDLVEVKNDKQEQTSTKNDIENSVKENTTADTTNTSETENTAEENVTNTSNSIVETEIAKQSNANNDKNTIVNNGKYKIADNARLKVIPLISAIELDELNKDTDIEVTEILNDWIKIKTADGKYGWVRSEKLKSPESEEKEENKAESNKTEENTEKQEETSQQKTETMYINTQTVNVREKASKSAKILKTLAVNTKVTVISSDGEWAYIDVNGTKGYVAKKLLSNTKQESSRSSMTERNATSEKNTTSTTNTASAANSNKNTKTVTETAQKNEVKASGNGSAVVAYAKQFLGCKYVYGGTSTSGFDCSGFTQYVYKNFGVSLNRTAAAQYSNGTAVTNLQAGDLVMFGKSGINHVGIYIGGNTFIHAANPRKGVRTDSLSSGYYKQNYVGARRVIQ